jgi:hypothetical protein
MPQRRIFKRDPELRFHLELAESLGMTREDLLSRMSSKEMTHWMALYTLRNEEREKAAKEAALRRGR